MKRRHLFDATTGLLTQTFDDPTPAAYDFFGNEVSVSGNNVLIGTRLDTCCATEGGSAYLFDATTGLLTQTFTNPVPSISISHQIGFGQAVSVDGNNVLIGNLYDETGATAAGSAYLFDATTGLLTQTFNNPTPTAFAFFGQSVAISGR